MRQFTGPAERSEAVRGGLRTPGSGSAGPDDAMPKPGSTCRRQVSYPDVPRTGSRYRSPLQLMRAGSVRHRVRY